MTPAPATVVSRTETPAPLIVGLDPGQTGALVALDTTGRVILAERCPLYRDTVDVAAIAAIGSVLRAHRRPILLVAEKPINVDGNSGFLALRQSVATWRKGLGLGKSVKIQLVDPREWQRAILSGQPPAADVLARGLKATKAQSIQWCRDRDPGFDLFPGRCTEPHDGLADARAIAEWALGEWRIGRLVVAETRRKAVNGTVCCG